MQLITYLAGRHRGAEEEDVVVIMLMMMMMMVLLLLRRRRKIGTKNKKKKEKQSEERNGFIFKTSRYAFDETARGRRWSIQNLLFYCSSLLS